MMLITALTGFQLFRPTLIEGEDLDAFIHGIAENLLHIVEMRLRHIDAVNAAHFGERLDIMIASAAEMDRAAAEAVEQTAVVGHGKFTVEIG